MQLSLFPTPTKPDETLTFVPITKILKPGAVVCAAVDIHFLGRIGIPAGTLGAIESSGPYTANVHFEGDPQNHYVVCLWETLKVKPNQPAHKSDVRFL